MPARDDPGLIVIVLAMAGSIAGSFGIIAWGEKSNATRMQICATLIASAFGGFLVGVPTGVYFGLKWFDITAGPDMLTVTSFALTVGASVYTFTIMAPVLVSAATRLDFTKLFWRILDAIRPEK